MKPRSLEIRLPEVQKMDFQKSKKWTSRSPKNGLLEVQKMDPNNTNNSDTDVKDTEYNIPSPTSPKSETKKEEERNIEIYP